MAWRLFGCDAFRPGKKVREAFRDGSLWSSATCLAASLASPGSTRLKAEHTGHTTLQVSGWRAVGVTRTANATACPQQAAHRQCVQRKLTPWASMKSPQGAHSAPMATHGTEHASTAGAGSDCATVLRSTLPSEASAE